MTHSAATPSRSHAAATPLPRGVWIAVGGLMLAKLVLHFLLNDTYGVMRDEYYYMVCADRLDWGYVDHPPLSIAMLAAVRATLGLSTFALRLLPVLAGAGTILTTALLARELGGRAYAVVLAALLTLLAPILLANGAMFSMNAFEQLLWPLVALVLLRLSRGASRRHWLTFGAILGLAALNKLGTVFFAAGLAVGVVATPLRRHLRTPWPWLGGAVTLAVVLPHLLWQAAHDWPFFEFAAQARAHKMSAMGPLEFLAGVALLFNPLTLPLWLGGLITLFLPAQRAARALGIAFVVTVALVMAVGGKTYYVAPAFPIVLAAGAVATDRLGVWLAGRVGAGAGRAAARVAGRGLRPVVVAIVILGGIGLAPLAVPTLPPATLVRYTAALGIEPPREERAALGALPQHFADRFGWERLVGEVATVWSSLPPEDRSAASVFARNYGEAAAIDVLGPAHGLPPAISLHNSYWLWGPRGATGEVVVAVGFRRADLDAWFTTVEERGRVVSEWAMPYENDLPIYVCRGLRVPIDRAWAEGRMFL